MLQEYLLSSHCILYLISSRVGIRQADLKLIEAIKILRLLPQTLFVLNVDLDEHDNMERLKRLQERQSHAAATAEAMVDLSARARADSLDDRLAAAGCGDPTKTDGATVLARLKSRSQDAK